ncbi:hypothetical protein C8R46DRAFT_1191829 [Mycena filopes]|nr:hypothetical protein C8R46DRAFT_1191829 [Mycena filopes]
MSNPAGSPYGAGRVSLPDAEFMSEDLSRIHRDRDHTNPIQEHPEHEDPAERQHTADGARSILIELNTQLESAHAELAVSKTKEHELLERHASLLASSKSAAIVFRADYLAGLIPEQLEQLTETLNELIDHIKARKDAAELLKMAEKLLGNLRALYTVVGLYNEGRGAAPNTV